MKQLKNFLFEYKTFNTVRLYNIRKQSYVIKNNSFSSKAQKNLICHKYSSPPILRAIMLLSRPAKPCSKI